MDPFKLQEMLGQAKQMQEQMQQKLSQSVVEASSGGGAVTVKMNGKKEILKITIDPSAVASLSGSTADVEMLEDLIAAAFNEAGRRAEELLKSSMQGMLGGLNLPPGLSGLPGMEWGISKGFGQSEAARGAPELSPGILRDQRGRFRYAGPGSRNVEGLRRSPERDGNCSHREKPPRG